MNSSNSMLSIHHFKGLIALFFITFLSFNGLLYSDDEKLQDLQTKLSITPPNQENYTPVLETIQGLIEALRAKDLERSYFVYTSKDFRNATPFQRYLLFIKANPILQKNSSASLLEIRIDKDIAYYKGVFSSTDGETKNVSIQLKNENGHWKILGIQIDNKK